MGRRFSRWLASAPRKVDECAAKQQRGERHVEAIQESGYASDDDQKPDVWAQATLRLLRLGSG